jgi:hypothetical protein
MVIRDLGVYQQTDDAMELSFVPEPHANLSVSTGTSTARRRSCCAVLSKMPELLRIQQ